MTPTLRLCVLLPWGKAGRRAHFQLRQRVEVFVETADGEGRGREEEALGGLTGHRHISEVAVLLQLRLDGSTAIEAGRSGYDDFPVAS